MEVYYQTDRCNLAIYGQTNNWFGTANEKGEIRTFFNPKDSYKETINEGTGDHELIKLN